MRWIGSAIIGALWRGQAVEANSLLPLGHWARASDEEMARYPHDVERAKRLLDEAGFRPGKDGVRLRITLKTSTDETTRLMAAVLQQQMRAAGIDLQIRSAEFGTFYADVTKGAFQMYALRWIGSNEDPDIFRYAYGSGSMPPKGGNRGRYSNARVDALLAEAAGDDGPGTATGGVCRGAEDSCGGVAGHPAVVSEQRGGAPDAGRRGEGGGERRFFVDTRGVGAVTPRM